MGGWVVKSTFKFLDKSGMEIRCLNTTGRYDNG